MAKVALIALLGQAEIKSGGAGGQKGSALGFYLFIFLLPAPQQYFQYFTVVKMASWKPAKPKLDLSKL